MARPSHVSRETRQFYSREYYWSNYRHEENSQIDQCYHSRVPRRTTNAVTLMTDSPVARILLRLRHRTSGLPKI